MRATAEQTPLAASSNPRAVDQEQGTKKETQLAVSLSLRAVVLGGGMAGLAAAQALSSEFDEVIILERDTLQNCQVKIAAYRKVQGSVAAPFMRFSLSRGTLCRTMR
jgi:heterodisulfide reductase subunit A-like polyferredoxin